MPYRLGRGARGDVANQDGLLYSRQNWCIWSSWAWLSQEAASGIRVPRLLVEGLESLCSGNEQQLA